MRIIFLFTAITILLSSIFVGCSLFNNEFQVFTEINAGKLNRVSYSSIALGDIDGDNDLDLILTGYGNGYVSKIYRNNY